MWTNYRHLTVANLEIWIINRKKDYLIIPSLINYEGVNLYAYY
jgi:hypothetical protein